MTPSELLDAIWPALVVFLLFLPIIFVNRPRRIDDGRLLRYLNRQPGLRMDVVRRLGKERNPIAEPLTSEEMAAVLLLWCNSLDRVDRYERLTGAIRDGWLDENGDKFFEAVERIGREIEMIDYGGYSAAMYKLGMYAARSVNAERWAERFDDQLIAFEDRYDLNRY